MYITFSGYIGESTEPKERNRVDEVEFAEHAVAQRMGSLLDGEGLGERKHQQSYVKQGEGEGKQCWILEYGE